MHDSGDVRIAPYGIDKMISALSVCASVAALYNNGQFRVGRLYGDSGGKRSTVQSVKKARIYVVGGVSRLPASGNHHQLIPAEQISSSACSTMMPNFSACFAKNTSTSVDGDMGYEETKLHPPAMPPIPI